MQVSKLFVLPLLLSSVCLTSCVQPPPKSYTAINGNWHIAGEEGLTGIPPSQSPLLTFAMGAIGNEIRASGDVGVNCSNGFGFSGSMSLVGQIASDGTFQLSNSAAQLDSTQITLKGKVPAAGETTWSGSYVVTNAASDTSCNVNSSSDFVATLYPPLNGTYSGTLTGRGLGSSITVTTQITQGVVTSGTLAPGLSPFFFAPLNATIAIGGSSGLTSGTTTASQLPEASSRLTGDSFFLTYLMNDGSKLTLSGRLGDSTGSTLWVMSTPFSGITASGTLTKQ